MNRFKLRSPRNVFMWSFAALAVVVSFQNCSSPFASKHITSTDSSSVIGSDAAAAASRFEAAKQVIQQNCTGCHYPGASIAHFSFTTEQEYIENGMVVAGSLARSKLIFRLKNYPVEIAGRNMPTDRTLTQEQYDVMSRWVLNMPGAVTAQSNYFTCNPDEPADRLDARRLSKTQLYNTLHALLSRPYGATQATTLLSSNANFFTNRVPNDTRAPYSKSDTNFEFAHAKAYFDIADELATTIVSANNYSQFVSTYINYNRGTCSYTSPDTLNDVCRDTLIRNFILRAWGRPLEENNTNLNNEMASLQREFTLAGNTTAGVNNMIFKALTSPQFLFHLHIDLNQQVGTSYRLSNFAIARRLSYNFMQSGLDEGLLAIAQSQDLSADAGFQNALAYVSARMQPALRDFTNEWLKLYSLPTFTNQSHPKFQMIAPNVTLNDSLRSAMADELMEFTTYLAGANRPATELLTSNVSFARHADLMRIYSQSVAAPATPNEQNAVRFPAAERAGLITRAAYLLGGSYNERPVMRGVHVREQVLCLELSGAAPPNAGATPLPADDSITTREKYHAITSGASCTGCHSQINPAGFALSHYNSLGGYQTMEPVFNANGQFVRQLPVSSTVSLQPVTGENREVQSPVEFSAALSSSQDFKRCMSQHFYSYFHGLNARTRAQNSCAMQRMYQSIEGGGTFADFIRSVALDPRFKFRNLVK